MLAGRRELCTDTTADDRQRHSACSASATPNSTSALQDIKHVSDHGYSVGAEANNPLIPGVLDAGASYSLQLDPRRRSDGHANTIGAYATAYAPFNGVKPFVGAGLGYQWTSFALRQRRAGLWGLTAGVEIPRRARHDHSANQLRG